MFPSQGNHFPMQNLLCCCEGFTPQNAVYFQFNGFPDELVHVSCFSGKKFCILEFNNMVVVDAVFRYAALSVCASRMCLLGSLILI